MAGLKRSPEEPRKQSCGGSRAFPEALQGMRRGRLRAAKVQGNAVGVGAGKGIRDTCGRVGQGASSFQPGCGGAP